MGKILHLQRSRLDYIRLGLSLSLLADIHSDILKASVQHMKGS